MWLRRAVDTKISESILLSLEIASGTHTDIHSHRQRERETHTHTETRTSSTKELASFIGTARALGRGSALPVKGEKNLIT